ncbi:tyrosine-type recombinase/integrase [Mobilicoccus massiliensis]|uniref:tyrosine-type recombinase/integrase n=1 Tax=Mobilicoccus massiliensis TaxID=1522310 RepID=UPI00059119D9|nr:site-specific integrase [Mobilicoccus massiliensis]
MARPPLPIGEAGAVNVQETSPGRFRARCRVRDQDGKVRQVAKFGATEKEARKELDAALKTRRPPTGTIRDNTRVSELASQWLARVRLDGQRAPSTVARYEWIVERIITPRVGEVRVGECTPARLDDFVDAVRDGHGVATARTTRACLSMMLGLAVRHGALDTNPVRELSSLPKKTDPARALTDVEAAALLAGLRKDTITREHDLVDLVVFMLGSGVRLGEACALLEEDVDLDDGTATIRATQTHKGRQERTKSRAGTRTIALPDAVVLMLRDRIADPRIRTDVALFPSPLGRPRDPSNTSSHLRRAFDRAGFPWVHSHTLRKTAATRMDAAGMTARDIADHLGHSMPSMTMDVYLGRGVASRKAAKALAMPLE